ncbi:MULTISPECIES: helix-turn-helix domain-containing protein [Streptomyces]|uniref:Helix-turn-helix domain-containing protein n=4 Tax=Streptomyces TaxID=1883 RepID=A0ABW9ICY4_STRGJ|nr:MULTISPECIES: helix-turn-helix domain-containing protein [Streptomyces]MBP5861367.1 transcriptional regulator [Streptomyces sp. LBUM 1484]MBP5869699.1 transcriptional regulator [Streptomyces sp. LBUM 1485]MBP5908105.1 transcriptional regulator [Streptomyces sp. LBUM 1478]MBP5928912.1 transcriptional regulator [Streptomyces sp. LBUM 1479]MBD9702104.1 transcriptional regulator [Streptomyces caniscabiei]
MDYSKFKPKSPIVGAARKQVAADMKKKYEAGASIRDLMEESRRSYGFVRGILQESKVTFRPRGGRHRSTAPS